MKKVDLIIDLQFGSTGKGLIAGYLAKRGGYDCCITANMPNAGHTFIDDTGRKWIHKVLPNGIVGKEMKYVMIGPGAVICPDRLMQEIDDSWDLMQNLTLLIHPNCGILQDRHGHKEQLTLNHISSTKQGSGAALMEKMERDPNTPILAREVLMDTLLEEYVCDEPTWRATLLKSKKILAEGAQGYSLGLNTSFWPYVTSRDCGPTRFLSDMGIPHNMLNKVIGTARTYPIRVGNTKGGTSGHGYDDQTETNWEAIGQKPEMTTVTQRERRVFTFSQKQIEEACFYCAPDEVFLNFCNYCTPSAVAHIAQMIDDACPHVVGGVVKYFGYQASETDVKERTSLVEAECREESA